MESRENNPEKIAFETRKEFYGLLDQSHSKIYETGFYDGYIRCYTDNKKQIEQLQEENKILKNESESDLRVIIAKNTILESQDIKIKQLQEEKESYYSMYNEEIESNNILRESIKILSQKYTLLKEENNRLKGLLKKAFIAGMDYGSDVTKAYEDGLPVVELDFEQWLEENNIKL